MAKPVAGYLLKTDLLIIRIDKTDEKDGFVKNPSETKWF